MSKDSLEPLGGGYQRHCNDVEIRYSYCLHADSELHCSCVAYFITSVMKDLLKDSNVQRICCSVRHKQLSACSCICCPLEAPEHPLWRLLLKLPLLSVGLIPQTESCIIHLIFTIALTGIHLPAAFLLVKLPPEYCIICTYDF